MEPMFPGALIVEGREGLRHAPNQVDGCFELLAKLTAEARALAFIMCDRRQNFRFGLGVDRDGFHG